MAVEVRRWGYVVGRCDACRARGGPGFGHACDYTCDYDDEFVTVGHIVVSNGVSAGVTFRDRRDAEGFRDRVLASMNKAKVCLT